jgi:predicted dehydrogenase
VAVVDANLQQAKAIASKFSVPALSEYHSLLGKVDAVSIATPTTTHFEIAKDFLNAHTHVLVEKPMTNSIETAREMVQIAKKNGCKLQIGYIERFNPGVIEVAQHKVSPIYIETLRSSPYRFRSGDIGVVLDLMIHDIDLVHFFVQSPLKKVDAIGSPLFGTHEDIANARLVFENGCVANISVSRAAMKPTRQMRLFAKDCYIFLDFASSQGKIIQKSKDLLPNSYNLQKSVPPEFSGLSFEEIFYGKILQAQDIVAKPHEPLFAELNSFVESITLDKPLAVSGEDGQKAMETAHLILCDIQKNLPN